MYQTPMGNAACYGNIIMDMANVLGSQKLYLSTVPALAEAGLRYIPVFLSKRGEEEDKEGQSFVGRELGTG